MTNEQGSPEGLRIYPADITPRHRDGYMARVDCLIHGFPGRIEINVDTHDRQYSSAEAEVFSPVEMVWYSVYSVPMNYAPLIDLPVLPDRPEALAALNALALTIWAKAQWVMSTSLNRQNVVDAITEVAKLEARDEYFRHQTAAAIQQAQADAEAARVAAEVDARRLDADVTVTVGGEDLKVDALYAEENPA